MSFVDCIDRCACHDWQCCYVMKNNSAGCIFISDESSHSMINGKLYDAMLKVYNPFHLNKLCFLWTVYLVQSFVSGGSYVLLSRLYAFMRLSWSLNLQTNCLEALWLNLLFIISTQLNNNVTGVKLEQMLNDTWRFNPLHVNIWSSKVSNRFNT